MKSRVPTVTMPECRFDAELTQKWLEGKQHGVEEVGRWLNVLAGEAFAERQDAKAKLFRELSDKILNQLVLKYSKAADDHEKAYLQDDEDKPARTEE